MNELEELMKINFITIKGFQIPSERSRLNAFYKYINEEINKISIKYSDNYSDFIKGEI